MGCAGHSVLQVLDAMGRLVRHRAVGGNNVSHLLGALPTRCSAPQFGLLLWVGTVRHWY
jgi:hypothetical protein